MTLQTMHAVGQTLVGCGSLIVPFSFKLSSPALAPLRPQINWVKTTELSPITYSVRPSARPSKDDDARCQDKQFLPFIWLCYRVTTCAIIKTENVTSVVGSFPSWEGVNLQKRAKGAL